jgi:hypothetical protein
MFANGRGVPTRSGGNVLRASRAALARADGRQRVRRRHRRRPDSAPRLWGNTSTSPPIGAGPGAAPAEPPRRPADGPHAAGGPSVRAAAAPHGSRSRVGQPAARSRRRQSGIVGRVSGVGTATGGGAYVQPAGGRRRVPSRPGGRADQRQHRPADGRGQRRPRGDDAPQVGVSGGGVSRRDRPTGVRGDWSGGRCGGSFGVGRGRLGGRLGAQIGARCCAFCCARRRKGRFSPASSDRFESYRAHFPPLPSVKVTRSAATGCCAPLRRPMPCAPPNRASPELRGAGPTRRSAA